MEPFEEFRQEVRGWLDENCPPGMRLPQKGVEGPAWGSPEFDEAADVWRVRMSEKGWTCPTWPVAFGGGGLDADHTKILQQEMGRIGTSNPVMSFGTHMLGPVLLEYASAEGTDATLQCWPGLVHVFQAFVPDLPEANEAIAEVRKFFDLHAPRSADGRGGSKVSEGA